MPHNFKRSARWALLAVLGACALILIAVATLTVAPGVLVPLGEWLLAPPGVSVKIAELHWGFRPPSLEARGVELEGWGDPSGYVRAERLDLALNARALWSEGAAPLVKTLGIRGLEIRTALGHGAGGGEPPALSNLSRVFWVEEAKIEDARVCLGFPAGELVLEGFRVDLRPEGDGGRRMGLRGAVRFEGPEGPFPEAEFSGSGRIAPDSTLDLALQLSALPVRWSPVLGNLSGSASLRLTPERLNVRDLSVAFEPADAAVIAGDGWHLGTSRIGLSGGVNLSGDQWEVSLRELVLGNLVEASGELRGPRLESLHGSVEGRIREAGEVRGALSSFMARPLPELRLSGSVPFSAAAELRGTESALELRLQPTDLGLAWEPGHLSAKISGEVAAEGRITAWREGRAALRGDLELAGGAQRSPWAVESYRASMKLGGELRMPSSPSVRIEIPADGVRHGGRPLPLGEIVIGGSWVYTESGYLRLPEIRIVSPALGTWDGKIDLRPEGPSGFLAGEGVSARDAVAIAQILAVPHAEDFGAAGTADLGFHFSRGSEGEETGIEVGISTESLTVAWIPVGLSMELGGHVSAVGAAGRAWKEEATLAGHLEIKGGLKREEWAISDLEMSLPLGGTLAAPVSRGWKLTVPAEGMLHRSEALSVGALSARGDFAILDSGAVEVDVAELKAAELGGLKGTARWSEGEVGGALQECSADAAKVLDVLTSFWGEELAGWSAAGRLDITGRFSLGGKGPAWDGGIAFKDLGFGSPDGALLSQGLGGKLNMVFDGASHRVESGVLTLDGGGILWETVFLDLGQSPLELRAEGRVLSFERCEDLDLSLKLEGFGRAHGAGDVSWEQGRWRPRGQVSLEGVQLGAVFGTFLREPLGASRPALAGLEVRGTGQIRLEAEPQGEGVAVAGRVQIDDLDVESSGRASVLQGFSLDLPFTYVLGRSPGNDPVQNPGDWGTLAWETAGWGDFEVSPLRVPVALVPNEFRVDGEIKVPLPGGAALLRDIRVENPLSNQFVGHLELDVEDLDLGRLGPDDFRLQGRLRGRLGPVVITRQELSSDGILEGELFGGQLEVSGLTVRKPLSAGREFGADITVSLMNLEALSTAFDVGRITGRLDAVVKELRVAYGQPVAFHLRAESVPVDGVEQRVSLKAVNSISLLSTGSAIGGAGLSLITAVFKEFPYKKIAFECDLRNDVFRVQGLIHENGVEYLVKRPLFGGINVVNRNPDNRIRFSDMVRRLERLTKRTGQQTP